MKAKLRGLDIRGVSVEELGLSPTLAVDYFNSGGPLLEDVFRHLPIGAADTIIDIGCGKGGAMITMAQFPFNAVHGLEISESLIVFARKNLNLARATNATVFQGDPREYFDYSTYSYIDMWNPFRLPVVTDLMSHIRQSRKLNCANKKLTLIYKDPT